MPAIPVHQALHNAIEHHQAGRLPEAEAIYRQILAVEPRHADALNLLGVIAAQAGHHQVAVDLFRQASDSNPLVGSYHGNLGSALRDQGRLDDAIAAYRAALRIEPDCAETHNNLGIAFSFGNRHEDAIAAYRVALEIQPDFAEAHYNMGVALGAQGRLDEAVAAYRRALELKPAYWEAHANLGSALKDLGRLDEAVAVCGRALELNPDLAEIHNNLGVALREQGCGDEAIAAYRRAVELKPACPEYHQNLGHALDAQGRMGEAVAAYRRVLDLKPDSEEARNGLFFSLHYLPDADPRTIFEEHCRWNEIHARPLARFIQPHANDRNTERRLRIGYVSPDFRRHAVAPMVLPLLASHDREKFQVYCYAEVVKPDEMTGRFRAQADQWRSTAGLSDEQVAGLIRQDQIDILVDLAGHTQGNRLLVLARKPAPVQVTRQGYPNTTGLTTIDYRMTDAYADPPGFSDTLHSEHLIRLPQTNWIYQPPEDCPAPIQRPTGAPVTFGCFNNFAKVTESMLRGFGNACEGYCRRSAYRSIRWNWLNAASRAWSTLPFTTRSLWDWIRFPTMARPRHAKRCGWACR